MEATCMKYIFNKAFGLFCCYFPKLTLSVDEIVGWFFIWRPVLHIFWPVIIGQIFQKVSYLDSSMTINGLLQKQKRE